MPLPLGHLSVQKVGLQLILIKLIFFVLQIGLSQKNLYNNERDNGSQNRLTALFILIYYLLRNKLHQLACL